MSGFLDAVKALAVTGPDIPEITIGFAVFDEYGDVAAYLKSELARRAIEDTETGGCCLGRIERNRQAGRLQRSCLPVCSVCVYYRINQSYCY
jgi:hypothetical protein